MSPAPRRVLMLTVEHGPIRIGGLGTLLESLCGALDPARFTPVVALPRSGHAPPWPRVGRRALPHGHAEIHRHGGAEIWLLVSELLDAPPIYPEPAGAAGIRKIDEYGETLAEALPEIGADLVHLHDFYGYKCAPAARALGTPVVYTVHRLHDEEPSWAFAEEAAVRLADVVTTVSRGYLEERADFFGAARDARAIPNGVDLDFWSLPGGVTAGRAARRRALLERHGLPDRPTFAYVGRLDAHQKGIDTLLEAMARLGAGADLNLVISGAGDRALAERVAAAAAAAPDRLRFLHGLTGAEEVRALLAAADGVVIPSRFEPFGLILVEAMAMGALPVASRTGGLAEILADPGEDPDGPGALAPPGDAGALASALARVARVIRDAPDEAAARRARAAARAARLSARAAAAHYEDLYDSLLHRHSPGTPETPR